MSRATRLLVILVSSMSVVLAAVPVASATPSSRPSSAVRPATSAPALVVPAGTAPGLVVTAAADDGAHWTWPVDGARSVQAPYRAPAHEYGAGHRGIDIAAGVGAEVRAPADGTVAFRGVVVDRPLLTIEHDGGLVTTLEPLDSTLSPGDQVSASAVVGSVAVGGHTVSGALHVGVRRDGEYINPLLLFGNVPRAILLPCCGPL